jgi:hypothetical protein
VVSITYRFQFDEGVETRFEVDLDRAPQAGGDLPAWTALDFEKCGNCPLQDSGGARCPAAADLSEVIEAFRDHLSYTRATLEVINDERTVVKECDMQTAIASLMGLVMATSGCPHLEPLRPLARFHLPFATREETLFRTVGAYLSRQYLRGRRGEDPDWSLEGLRQLYRDLTEVNTGFTERVRAAASKDAALNAIVNLFSLTILIALSLDDDLRALAEIFGENEES